MEYWVDFSGYLKIKADSKKDAERKMWELISGHFNVSSDYSDDAWCIDNIEEVPPDNAPAGDW